MTRIGEIASIRDLRSVVEVTQLPLSQLTLFVGPNNSGKSTLLQSVLALQEGLGVSGAHVRLGAQTANVALLLEDLDLRSGLGAAVGQSFALAEIEIQSGQNISVAARGAGGDSVRLQPFPAQEPNHLVIPYLSQRRPERFEEEVSAQYALGIHPTMRFLGAKLARLVQSAHPGSSYFSQACRDILGFQIGLVQSPNGQIPGVFVGMTETIPLSDMGAGVAQIVGLLADLALAEEKVFVLEEPETDLHPAALRALLDLVVQAAEKNQFLVSTHSNIVLRHLGSQEDSRIYYVDADQRGGWPPVTEVREVKADSAARSEVLVDLGYELSDFEFYDGWLFLEEASAESIIRDHLIPWFAPRLSGRLRTVSAKGSARVIPTFDDFNRLVLFTHLEERYRNRAWVLVDGDEPGVQVAEKLQLTYEASWASDRFQALQKEHFELYYPPRFAAQAQEALALTDPQGRHAAKRALLSQVLAWCASEPEVAREEFGESAEEPISHLRRIESQLLENL